MPTHYAVKFPRMDLKNPVPKVLFGRKMHSEGKYENFNVRAHTKNKKDIRRKRCSKGQ